MDEETIVIALSSEIVKKRLRSLEAVRFTVVSTVSPELKDWLPLANSGRIFSNAVAFRTERRVRIHGP